MTSPLPADFTPSPNDVVIGKGKKFYYHPGNAMLRQYVTDRLDEYSAATTKIAKSNIITNVVDTVREKGKFVKLDPEDNKTWLIAEDLLCREKCSACFRETLRNNDSAQRLAKLGSSNDLIHALKMTKINSGNNLHRVAMSTGNLLSKRPSQGQFAAAKKASFNRLSGALGGGGGGNGGAGKNATWSPKVRPNKPGVDSRQLRGLLTNFRTHSQRKLAASQGASPHQANPFLNGGLLGQQQQQAASPLMVGSSPNNNQGLHPMMVGSGGGQQQQAAVGGGGYNNQTSPSILQMQQQQRQVQQMQQQQQQLQLQQQQQQQQQNLGILEPTPLMEPTPIQEGLKQFENQMALNSNANDPPATGHPGAISITPDPISPATEKLLTQPLESLLNTSDSALPELDVANDPLLADTLEGVTFGQQGGADGNASFDALLDMPIMEIGGTGNNNDSTEPVPISNEALQGFAW